MVRGVGVTRSTWLSIAVATPAVVLGVIEVVALAMAVAGAHPRWPNLDLNLAEATAVRNNAEIARQLERGDDPNTPRSVRPGLVGNAVPVTLTPLEAAVSIRRTELIGMLGNRGARLTAEEWRHLSCAARAMSYDDVVGALGALRPADAGVELICAGDERLW